MEETSITVGGMSDTPVKDLIEQWPSRAALAADLADIIGTSVPVDRVHKWAQSDSIPAWFHAHVVAAGHKRGIEISFEKMALIHAMKPAGILKGVSQ